MRHLLLFLFVLFSFTTTHAHDPSVETFLREFHENPDLAMNRLPTEIRDGKAIDRGFLQNSKPDSLLLREKLKQREDILNRSEKRFETWTTMTDDDRPEILVDGGIVQLNIKELDRLGLSSRFLTHLSWSDTYWPTANGLIAARYTEPSFPHNKNWLANYTSYLNNPAHSISTDHLSPAEKYDLLVGDGAWTMTNYSWRQGEVIQNAIGRVPGWMGLCHGWSAANHMQSPIPYSSITLQSPSGQSIRFYQSDMKALITMMWAKTELPTRFIGFRCERTAPRDGTGRIIDPKCFDTNPASLHLSLTNQIGLHNRGFVMDATAEAEVWNYPVIGYRSTYFNPQTSHQTDNVNQAIVSKENFTIDKFKIHRARGTAYVIGVVTELTHLNETSPSHNIQVKPATLTKRYIYDLELDSNFNVIGGEWYTRAHPDFIWGYSRDAIPLAPQDIDLNINDWDITKPVPADWRKAARAASVKGLPLYSVIRRILQETPNSPRSLE